MKPGPRSLSGPRRPILKFVACALLIGTDSEAGAGPILSLFRGLLTLTCTPLSVNYTQQDLSSPAAF